VVLPVFGHIEGGLNGGEQAAVVGAAGAG